MAEMVEITGIREKTAFIPAFIGGCRGTRIFSRLIRQHPLRAVLHFALAAVLCAVFIAAVRIAAATPKLEASMRLFEGVYGGVEVYADCWLPERHRQQQRAMLLPDQGVLNFVPSAADPKTPAELGVKEPAYLVYWLPTEIALIQPISDKDFFALFAQPSTGGVRMVKGDIAEIKAELAAVAARPVKAEGAAKRISAPELLSQIRLQGALALFINYFFICGPGALFYLLLFVGMFHLVGLRQNRVLKFRELFLCAVYAALPVMPVAALFPAFDLPLLTCSSAIMLGSVIYFMVVVSNFERGATNRKSGE